MYIETDHHAGIRIEHPVSGETEVSANSIFIHGSELTGISYQENSSAPWPISDHNNVYWEGPAGHNNKFGNYNTLLGTQILTTMEDHSISAKPKYQGPFNLHIDDSSPNIYMAAIRSDIGLDYDKDPRQFLDLHYDIGADEFGNLGWKSAEASPRAVREDLHVMAFPNPNAGLFRIVGEFRADAAYQVLDLQGRIIDAGSLGKGSMDITGMSAGKYVLRITSGTAVGHATVVVE